MIAVYFQRSFFTRVFGAGVFRKANQISFMSVFRIEQELRDFRIDRLEHGVQLRMMSRRAEQFYFSVRILVIPDQRRTVNAEKADVFCCLNLLTDLGRVFRNRLAFDYLFDLFLISNHRFAGLRMKFPLAGNFFIAGESGGVTLRCFSGYRIIGVSGVDAVHENANRQVANGAEDKSALKTRSIEGEQIAGANRQKYGRSESNDLRQRFIQSELNCERFGNPGKNVKESQNIAEADYSEDCK